MRPEEMTPEEMELSNILKGAEETAQEALGDKANVGGVEPREHLVDKAAKGNDDDEGDDDDEGEGGSERTLANRTRRQEKKERRREYELQTKARLESLQLELTEINKERETLRQQLSQVTQTAQNFTAYQYQGTLDSLKAQYAHAENEFKQAGYAMNPDGQLKAQEKLWNLHGQIGQLEQQKSQYAPRSMQEAPGNPQQVYQSPVQQQMAQPAYDPRTQQPYQQPAAQQQGGNPFQDPVAFGNLNNFLLKQEHSWIGAEFNQASQPTTQDAAKAAEICNNLVFQHGYNPKAESFWELAAIELKRALPHKYAQQYGTRQSPPVSTAAPIRNAVATGREEIRLTNEEKTIITELKDAGILTTKKDVENFIKNDLRGTSTSRTINKGKRK